MIDLATELMNIVPHLREQHQYYSASVCYRAAEFLREYCEGHDSGPSNTNADRIRAMTDEEMVFELACSGCPKEHFIKDNEFVDCPAAHEPSKADCVKCWLDYLNQEVTTNSTT